MWHGTNWSHGDLLKLISKLSKDGIDHTQSIIDLRRRLERDGTPIILASKLPSCALGAKRISYEWLSRGGAPEHLHLRQPPFHFPSALVWVALPALKTLQTR